MQKINEVATLAPNFPLLPQYYHHLSLLKCTILCTYMYMHDNNDDYNTSQIHMWITVVTLSVIALRSC